MQGNLEKQGVGGNLQNNEGNVKKNGHLQSDRGPQLRRSTQERKKPEKFNDYELLFSDELLHCGEVEPAIFKQACKSIDSVNWMEAMIEEMESLRVNNTWDLVSLPPN